MRALIRENELMTEPFSPWVEANIPFLTAHDGWTLIDDYMPKEEPLCKSD